MEQCFKLTEFHFLLVLCLVFHLLSFQLSHFIEHEYLDEQIEFIKELKDYETRLAKINEHYIGLLLFDRWLQEDKKNKS